MRLKGEREGEMIDAALKGVCERQCVCVWHMCHVMGSDFP